MPARRTARHRHEPRHLAAALPRRTLHGVVRYFPGGPRLAFFVLLVAVLAGAWYAVRPVAGALLLAAAVASLAQGANRWLIRRLHGRRRIAAALEVTALLLLLFAPLTLLVIVGTGRLVAEMQLLPDQLSRAQAALSRLAERLGSLGPSLSSVTDRVSDSLADAAPTIANRIGTCAAVLHGVLSGLGYWIFGVGAPLLWALVTAVASFIPVFGTALVWAPLSVGVMMSSGWLWGLGLVAYGTITVGGADNVVRPYLMRGGLELHPLLVFAAVLGGVEAFGASGIFLGPLLVALAVAALDIYDKDDTGPSHSRPRQAAP